MSLGQQGQSAGQPGQSNWWDNLGGSAPNMQAPGAIQGQQYNPSMPGQQGSLQDYVKAIMAEQGGQMGQMNQGMK